MYFLQGFSAFFILTIMCPSLCAAQIHVGSSCNKHTDCIRYCAYSRHGVEGVSCCFPEKIRVSRSVWIKTGSSTCYCCPLPQKHLGSSYNITELLKEWDDLDYNSLEIETQSKRKLQLQEPFGGVNYCPLYVNSYDLPEEESEDLITSDYNTNTDVTHEFCTNRCVQVMMNVKMGFEFPSLCRARKLTTVTKQ